VWKANKYAVWKANKYANREFISCKHLGGFYRTHFASSSNCCSWLRHVCEIFAAVVWWASHNVVLNPFCVNAFTKQHICEACFVLGNWRYCTLRQGQIDIKPLKYVGYVVGEIFQCDISGHSPVEIQNPVPVSQARFRQFGVIESFYAESMKAATNAMIAGPLFRNYKLFIESIRDLPYRHIRLSSCPFILRNSGRRESHTSGSA